MRVKDGTKANGHRFRFCISLASGLTAANAALADCPLFPAEVHYAVGNRPYSVSIGDLDGDQVPDLAAANAGSGNVSVLFGVGDGTFVAAAHYAAGHVPTSVAIGDLNGDHVFDLAVANAVSNDVSVLLGIGDGMFAATANYAVGDGPRSVAIGDLDGDRILDLAVTSYWDDSVSVLFGVGDGTFVSAAQVGAGLAPQSVAIGDLDGDQIPDLVVANGLGGNVSVLLGVGDGTFAAAVRYFVGAGPRSVAIGDLDGNLIPDVAVVNEGAGTVSVLLGAGDGTFATDVRYAAGNRAISVAIRDLNGDQVPDLAVANWRSDNISVLLGVGDGTFAAAVHYAVGDGPHSVAIGDLDGDQVPDLAVANEGSDNVSVLLNQVGDFNGNGVPDECDIDCGPPGGPCDLPGCGLSADCNGTGVLDECEIADNDCNGNGILDECDIPVCGDACIMGTEECDDGNTEPDDGCDDNCLFEQGACCLGSACVIAAESDCLDSGGTFFGLACDAPDADSDGLRDECDGCPADPHKIEPGICGCGEDDTADSDGDSVPDCRDQCPGSDDASEDCATPIFKLWVTEVYEVNPDGSYTPKCGVDCPTQALLPGIAQPGDLLNVEVTVEGWDADTNTGECIPTGAACDMATQNCPLSHCTRPGGDGGVCTADSQCLHGQTCVPDECRKDPLLGAFQWTIDSSTYSNGGPGPGFVPVELACTTDADCACAYTEISGAFNDCADFAAINPGFCTCTEAACSQNVCHPAAAAYIDSSPTTNYVFFSHASFEAISLFHLDYEYAAASLDSNVAGVPEELFRCNAGARAICNVDADCPLGTCELVATSPYYLGTLLLEATGESSGLYTLDLVQDMFNGAPLWTFLNDNNAVRLPTPIVEPLIIDMGGQSEDCNGNGTLDECDIDCGPPGGPCDTPGCGQSVDCNNNALPDECDIASGTSTDVFSGHPFLMGDGIPDECQFDRPTGLKRSRGTTR